MAKDENVHCANCGRMIWKYARMCPYCHTHYDVDAIKRRERRGCLLWIAGGFLFLLILYMLGKPESSNTPADESQSDKTELTEKRSKSSHSNRKRVKTLEGTAQEETMSPGQKDEAQEASQDSEVEEIPAIGASDMPVEVAEDLEKPTTQAPPTVEP